MSLVAIYDTGHVNERVLRVLPSVHTPDYEGRPDVVMNPDLSGLVEPQLYWRHDTGTIRDMDTGEKSALDAELAAEATTANRASALLQLDESSGDGVQKRAQGDMLIREVNILRGWIEDFKVEVAAAVSLADFQARVAGLPTLPDRTLGQARTRYRNLTNAGDADGQW